MRKAIIGIILAVVTAAALMLLLVPVFPRGAEVEASNCDFSAEPLCRAVEESAQVSISYAYLHVGAVYLEGSGGLYQGGGGSYCLMYGDPGVACGMYVWWGCCGVSIASQRLTIHRADSYDSMR